MRVSLTGLSARRIYSCASHCHNDWEIVLVLSGSGEAVFENRTVSFSAGTIYCCPPDMRHHSQSKDGFQDLYLQVQDFPFHKETDILVFSDDEAKSFQGLLFLIHRFFHKKENNYARIVDAAYETLCQLLFAFAAASPKNECVEFLKNQLILGYSNPEFEIRSAMDKTPLCNDHLRRCFKAETGMTPLEYLTSLRIGHAKKLLAQKENARYSLQDVALLSGYYDAQYFSRLFRKKTGMTPSAYARSAGH